jgi:hypothetical protein
MAYPDNVFESDQLEEDQYGGADPDIFDNQAWTWITGLIRSVSKRFLSHVRVSWDQIVVTVQEGVAIGDVLAVDLSQDALDPTTQAVLHYVKKYSTIVGAGGTPKIIGVCVAAASALGRTAVATGGLLPQSISGITSIGAASLVAADATTSRLRLATNSDDTMGYSSPQGSVLLEFIGRVSV